MSVLDTIIAEKYTEVAGQKMLVPVTKLEKKPAFQREPLSLKAALLREGSSGVIAEFKRKSPSKGIINGNVRVEDVTQGYAAAGAAGLSVLTDRQFFGGSLIDLMVAREANTIPILRKDFMVDEYQIVEAKAMGADVILLIAAALDAARIRELASCAKSLGLEILFEVHTVEELDKLTDDVDMVGVNNRNLKDFKVEIDHSLRLAQQIPDRFVKVSESGLDNPATVNHFRQQGFKGFLIGENFMKTEVPGDACAAFIRDLTPNT